MKESIIWVQSIVPLDKQNILTQVYIDEKSTNKQTSQMEIFPFKQLKMVFAWIEEINPVTEFMLNSGESSLHMKFMCIVQINSRWKSR